MQRFPGFRSSIIDFVLLAPKKVEIEMQPQLNRLKKLTRKFNLLGFALLTIPIAVSLTACQSQVSVGPKESELANREATAGKDVVLFPDAVPSVYDGSVYWQQNNCASCHGAEGKGVAGQCDIDLTNVERMRQRKPVDQYKLISFGSVVEEVTPVTSALGLPEGASEGAPGENAPAHGTEPLKPADGAKPADGSKPADATKPVEAPEPANPPKPADAEGHEAKEPSGRLMKHEAYLDKLNKRQRWDLVFYARSLAVPLLSDEERLAMKAVFGANCAVCHGSRGAGDGQLNKGLVLQPAPANFTQFDRFYDRTDEQIWDHIAHGIRWEGMPNFLGKQDRGNKVKFDADYIWKLTQYVRNFHEDSAPALEGKKSSRNNTESPSAISTNIKEKAAADKARIAKELDSKQSVH